MARGTATAGRSRLADDEERPIDRLLTLVGYLPIGVENLVRTAAGARWRLPVIPAVLVLLTALTIVPVGQALIEIIVRPVTVAELVDRRVGLSTRLVKVDGFALLVPLDADPPPDASGQHVYHWYAVRDSLQEQRMVLVRSEVVPESLTTRSMVVRLVDDPGTLERTRAGIVARGGDDPGTAVARFLLVEVDPEGEEVTQVGSVADLNNASPGQTVRLRLTVEAGIATCMGRGDCSSRNLANGVGSWDNLATDANGGWAVVRTLYPPSVAPFHGVGHHAQDRELVGRLLALPLVRGLLGWGHVLMAAHVEHDLGLPIDHLWLGPILFTLIAVLLLFGLRAGYPRFSARPMTASAPSGGWTGILACRATGRISPPGASPFEIDDAPATLRGDPSQESVLTVEVEGRSREFLVPRNLGGLGTTEFGDLLTVRSVRPALRVGWFGSNLLLVFADRGARDAAAAIVRGS